MKASAARRKSRAQIEQEKLEEQQREAEIAARMAEYERMKQEVEAVKATKVHVEQLFKDGCLFRDENGDVNMPASEEIRQQVAESARKPQEGSHQHSAFVFESPAFGQGQQQPVPEEAKRSLEEEFADARGDGDQRFDL